MRILPKTPKETRNIVYDILNQGDSRYNDSESELILANSITCRAVYLEEIKIPETLRPKLTSKEIIKMRNIQADEKYVAKILLKKRGFKDNQIFFERMFRGSRPDLLVEMNGEFIPIECCSCRVDKIIDYLKESKEVWVITREFSNEKMKWFIFKRGEKWEKFLDYVEKKEIEEIKKIQSPIDGLY